MPSQVDELTLDDVTNLFQDWQHNPPVCDLVHALAIWAGAVKPPETKRNKSRKATASPVPAMSMASFKPFTDS